MLAFFLALFGLLLGAALDRHGGWVYGLLGGWALGLAWAAHSRIQRLAEELALLRRRVEAMDPVADLREASQPPRSTTSLDTQHPVRPERTTKSHGPVPALGSSRSSDPEPITRETPVVQPPEPITAPAPSRPAAAKVAPAWASAEAAAVPEATEDDPWNPRPARARVATGQASSNAGTAYQPGPAPWDPLVRWFMQGNPIAKVGVVVLFFGVAFLLKYVSERGFLSVGMRLSGVAALGLAMVLGAFRLPQNQRLYALSMQGGGLGVLYLTVFAAYRLYHLIPSGPAFALLLVLTSAGVALAVMQNALALATLAVSGGFLAPVLISTGSGSHVALFSYYLVLNLGIFVIAWFRAWRILNWLGFVFTFVIAIVWGAKYYQPFYFASVEPFLIAFFLLYLGISVLYAFRQPPRLRGYVDGTLVFGLPLVSFGLQSALLHGERMQLAWSALSLAGLYALLAWGLWRRLKPESRLLCEAFVALAVVFATLSIPLALEAQWSSAMWALEGGALVWISTRQRRFLGRLFGYLLQFAAFCAWLIAQEGLRWQTEVSVLFINSWYLGILLLAVSALFIATYVREQRATVGEWESRVWARIMFFWGIALWYIGGVVDIFDHLTRHWEWPILLCFLSLSAVLAHGISRLWFWRAWWLPSQALIWLGAAIALPVLWEVEGPLRGALAWSWPLMFAVHYFILRRQEGELQRRSDLLPKGWQAQHLAGFWLILFLVVAQVMWWAEREWGVSLPLQLSLGWTLGMLMALIYLGRKFWPWPMRTHPDWYYHVGLSPVAVVLGLWFWGLCLQEDGQFLSWTYWPVFNPLDLSLAAAFALLLRWSWLSEQDDAEEYHAAAWRYPLAPVAFALSAWLWVNSQWLRFAHHHWGIRFEFYWLWVSTEVQAGLSLLWAGLGLVCMVLGTRRSWRWLWLVGAGLMAMVVVKLFLVDLANSGTLARIISFMVVGGVLMLVGYFSPVPPKQEEFSQARD